MRALADRLKAPLIHSVKGQDIIAYDDPRWIGGIGMIGTKAVYNAVMSCDLLLMLGTDYPYSEFLPQKGAVIQIDDRARVLGRRTPTALGVAGSVRPTLQLLLEKIAAKTDSKFFDRITTERKKWDAKLDKQADPARSKDQDSPAGGGARRQRPRQPRRGFRPRHRPQHAVVGQLDPPERHPTHYRLIQ